MTNLPKSMSRILNIAMETARQSPINAKHGAVLFSHTGKHIYANKSNCNGHKAMGYHVPAIHAEACVLHTINNYLTHKGKGRQCREKEWCLQHGHNGC